MDMELNSSSIGNISLDEKKWTRCEISNWTLAKRINSEQPLLPVVCSTGVLLLTGVIGNGLVIYVYSRKPKTTTNRVFILALSILDFLSCSVVIPFEIYDMTHSHTFTIIALCKLARFSEFLLILAAGFTLVAISIDRYLHLCRYKSRFLLSASRAKKVCALCVALGAVFSLPLLRNRSTRTLKCGRNPITNTKVTVKNTTVDPLRLMEDFPMAKLSCFFICLFCFVCLFFFVCLFSCFVSSGEAMNVNPFLVAPLRLP
jgi:hypothetical protein